MTPVERLMSIAAGDGREFEVSNPEFQESLLRVGNLNRSELRSLICDLNASQSDISAAKVSILAIESQDPELCLFLVESRYGFTSSKESLGGVPCH